MGQFKERKIEEVDVVLHDIAGIKKQFHEEEATVDSYSLFLPHFDKESGGLLPHERPCVPASCVFDALKK